MIFQVQEMFWSNSAQIGWQIQLIRTSERMHIQRGTIVGNLVRIVAVHQLLQIRVRLLAQSQKTWCIDASFLQFYWIFREHLSDLNTRAQLSRQL
jgi:hypothetical protein